MGDKPKIVVKQDSNGNWRDGGGKFVPAPIKKPGSGKVKE